jgi:hypothetical protein
MTSANSAKLERRATVLQAHGGEASRERGGERDGAEDD